jgi:pimeloyl-ACP methyl ester carboxylesterase
MGGYIAFELLRQQPERLISLALLDTKATADQAPQRARRLADRDRARTSGLDNLVAELPRRWLAPNHAADPARSELVRSMAGTIGLDGLIAQQDVMMARPDSLADLARVACPTLVVVGRQDQVTPLADHETMVEHLRKHRADCRFEIIEDCGHLSTIEQPAVTSQLLHAWLKP